MKNKYHIKKILRNKTKRKTLKRKNKRKNRKTNKKKGSKSYKKVVMRGGAGAGEAGEVAEQSELGASSDVENAGALLFLASKMKKDSEMAKTKEKEVLKGLISEESGDVSGLSPRMVPDLMRAETGKILKNNEICENKKKEKLEKIFEILKELSENASTTGNVSETQAPVEGEEDINTKKDNFYKKLNIDIDELFNLIYFHTNDKGNFINSITAELKRLTNDEIPEEILEKTLKEAKGFWEIKNAEDEDEEGEEY